ncbi:hypothetical protein EXW95_09520 [Deinococcus sp. JMULE3]|nr:hypothetical protein [Deinococcus sp. JMULE3]
MSAPWPTGGNWLYRDHTWTTNRANLIRAVVLGGEGGTLTLLGPQDGRGEFFFVHRNLVDLIDDEIPVYDGAKLVPAGRDVISALNFMQPEWQWMTGVHVAPPFRVAIEEALLSGPKPYDHWFQNLPAGGMACRGVWRNCDLWPDGRRRDGFWLQGNIDQVRALVGRLPYEHQVQLEHAAHEPFALLVSRDGAYSCALPHVPSGRQESWIAGIIEPLDWFTVRTLADLQTVGLHELYRNADPHVLLVQAAMQHFERLRAQAFADDQVREFALKRALWDMGQITWPFRVIPSVGSEPWKSNGFDVYMAHGMGDEEFIWHVPGQDRDRDAVGMSVQFRNLYYRGNREALRTGQMAEYVGYALEAVQALNEAE